MGTDLTIFIEFDETRVRWERWEKSNGKPPPEPFASGNEIQSVTEDGSLYAGSKGYAFFGAIAGVRNNTGIPPLYPLRGAPQSMSWRVSAVLGYTGYTVAGWLTLAEINAALNHHEVGRDRINDEVVNILDFMEILERRYGVGWVRMLFYFVG